MLAVNGRQENQIKVEMNEENIDNAINHLFIHFKIFFEDNESEEPISNILRDTKFSDILDEFFCTEKEITFRSFIHKIAHSISVPMRLKVTEDTNMEYIIAKTLKDYDFVTQKVIVDSSPVVDFFSELTIEDICSYSNPEIDLI